MNAVAFANGVINDYTSAKNIFCEYMPEYVLACDGGLRHCLAMGITPHAIIGDMDSAPPDALAYYAHVPILTFPPEKDATDLELAMAHLYEKGAQTVLALGALGGRFDHQLAHLHVMAGARARGMDLLLQDETTRVQYVTTHTTLHRHHGETVSLYPFGLAEGIVTRGLLYPLCNEPLPPGVARGTSNQMTADTAEIALDRGAIVVVQSV